MNRRFSRSLELPGRLTDFSFSIDFNGKNNSSFTPRQATTLWLNTTTFWGQQKTENF